MDGSRFTAGRWCVEAGTVRAGKIKIAQHWPGLLDPAEADANNNLIAAAPEMYAALKAAIANLKDKWGEDPFGPFPDAPGKPSYDLAVAALAKAEGRNA
jgi:hypothetical protein